MIVTSEKILERNVLRGLSEYEKGVCDVVAAVMSFSYDAQYKIRCAEADIGAYKIRLDAFAEYLPGWCFVHNDKFVDDAVGVYDPLCGELRDAKGIFESVKNKFSTMPPALLRSDICSFIQECISLCDSLITVVEQYKAEEASISQDGKRCLELKRAFDDGLMKSNGYNIGFTESLLLDSSMSEDECVRKLDDVGLMLQGTVAYELTKGIDEGDEEAVASMLYHKTKKDDYVRYFSYKLVKTKLGSILHKIKERLQKKRVEGWVMNRKHIDNLRTVHNRAQMYKGELSATQCAFVVFREFVEHGYTIGGEDGWRTLSCSAFVHDMNKGVEKGSDNFISEKAFCSFRKMCKNVGSLYGLPDDKNEKYWSQLKVLQGTSLDVGNVINAVEKAFAPSETAIA